MNTRKAQLTLQPLFRSRSPIKKPLDTTLDIPYIGETYTVAFLEGLDGDEWQLISERVPANSVEDPNPNSALHWLPAADAVASQDRAWSVDFARDETGDWWLIDMAVAADSWHPDCEQEAVIGK